MDNNNYYGGSFDDNDAAALIKRIIREDLKMKIEKVSSSWDGDCELEVQLVFQGHIISTERIQI